MDPEPITEESFTVFISYIIAGAIIGIMMFGFAEIINILDKKHKTQEETLTKLNDLKWEFGGLMESRGKSSGDTHQEVASQKEKGKFGRFMDDVEKARNN
ncbi:hypothetical protein M3E13_16045 [Oceanobacillus kimchii]|uniref:hypothetical protein n=1 Tax=Oceanobacillus kimchii TaxID=746691 RepID=UPI0021A3D098|nr:hypothetical protein [Oceanobacillus kimchii]MCT1579063.1 hypothetical protein [Oceanobacillus kimchii]MCT2137409.1 hypothetical protein [Oceanobacillus kimchii]